MHVLALFLGLSWSSGIELNATRRSIETRRRVSVNLTWEEEFASDHYMIFSKKMSQATNEDTRWMSIGTYDMEANDEPIRVLNIYPTNTHCNAKRIYPATYTYANGTKESGLQSASLRVLIEGGKIGNTAFDNLALTPTGEQFITIDSISLDEMNTSYKLVWNYDIVVIGIWDASGVGFTSEIPQHECNTFSSELVNELRAYLDAHYSIILTHDFLGPSTRTDMNLGPLRGYFGVKTGRGTESVVDKDCRGVAMTENWQTRSQTVDVVQIGALTDYPREVSQTSFSCKRTHTCGNIATGKIWMTLRDVNSYDDVAFRYDGSCYPKGFETSYVSTYNNTAFIQLGHSEAIGTTDERKVFVNLIHLMKQRTKQTSAVDQGPVDTEPPTVPNCTCLFEDESDRFVVKCEATDQESLYLYKVVGYDENNTVVNSSEEVEVDAASGFSHFMYLANKNSDTPAADVLNEGTKSTTGVFERHEVTEPFMHILSVDAVGNSSPVLHYRMYMCDYTDQFDVSKSSRSRLGDHLRMAEVFIFQCVYQHVSMI